MLIAILSVTNCNTIELSQTKLCKLLTIRQKYREQEIKQIIFEENLKIRRLFGTTHQKSVVGQMSFFRISTQKQDIEGRSPFETRWCNYPSDVPGNIYTKYNSFRVFR